MEKACGGGSIILTEREFLKSKFGSAIEKYIGDKGLQRQNREFAPLQRDGSHYRKIHPIPKAHRAGD